MIEEYKTVLEVLRDPSLKGDISAMLTYIARVKSINGDIFRLLYPFYYSLYVWICLKKIDLEYLKERIIINQSLEDKWNDKPNYKAMALIMGKMDILCGD